MPQSEILLKIVFTIVFGAILGLEAETREGIKDSKTEEQKEKSRLGGVRTYTIISLFGGVAGLFYLQKEFTLTYILSGAITALILSAYILNVQIKKAFGMTTELAVIITFVIGFLTTSGVLDITIVLVILILLAFFLSNKRGITVITNRIEHKEIQDVLKFGLISLVILPVLPNRNFFVSDIAHLLGLGDGVLGSLKDFVLLNPFQIWFTVVLVSGFSLVGYILARVLGKTKGILLTGFFSGFVSSTAAMISFGSKTRHKGEDKNSLLYAASGLLANGSSFIVLGVILLINSTIIFKTSIPFLVILFLSSLAVGGVYILLSRRNAGGLEHKVDYQPFSVIPAIRFVSLILAVKLFIQFLQTINADPTLLIFLTALSGFVSIDAPAIAVAGLVESSGITLTAGFITIVLANFINFFAKIIYSSLSGTKNYFRYISIGLIIVGAFSLLAFFVT